MNQATRRYLAKIPTCEIQWELDKREGVSCRALSVESELVVLIDGERWVKQRGPLTVTVNID